MSTLRIEIVSGALAGRSFTFSRSSIILGRDPRCDLQLDPHEDVQVSSKHALLSHGDDAWWLRDLGSRNGTFVDGRRIEGDVQVGTSNVIRLGPQGPEMKVLGVGEAQPPVASAVHSTSAVRPSTLKRPWRFLSGGMLAALALVVWGTSLHDESSRWAWERERAALLVRVDSILEGSEEETLALAGRVSGLADSLRASRSIVVGLRAELRSPASGDRSEEFADLQRRLTEATLRLSEQELAASLDWDEIRRLAESGVARVFVEREDGTVEAGTSFVVESDGTLVTAAHLLVGPDGRQQYLRIAIQFAGNTKVVPAELVEVASGDDLALLRVADLPLNLVALSLNWRLDTVQAGQPVAIMGFPLQSEVPVDARGTLLPATPLATAGILQDVGLSQIEVSGYGERGASGSPVMDATGVVLGLLRGVITREERRILVVVPAAQVLRLLQGRR